jgi:peptide/nickel transport system permease protein/peptide/nickel transport system substrate-binding protein
MSKNLTPPNSGALSRRRLLQATSTVPFWSLDAFAQGADKAGVLRVAAPHNPSTLDPMTGRSGPDHVYLYALFDTLVEWDYAALTPKPGLAESWTYPDPNTLVLKLRRGVKFQDGEAFDAEAVKANLDWGRSNEKSSVKVDLASIDAMEVRGSHEIALKLKRPDRALPLILSDRAGMMRSPKAVREKGADHDRSPVGTGAYKFVSWADKDQVVLTRNPDYWKRDMAKLEGIVFKVIREPQTALRSVVAGDNDLTYYVPPQQRAVAERSGKLAVNIGPSLQVGMLYFNYGRGPLKDVRVRRALNFAVDRAAYIKATSGGLGEVADMALPKSHWAYAPELAGFYKYDPERAKALLREAGLANGVDIHLIAWNDQLSVQRTEVLIEMFKKANIRLKVTTGSGVETAGQFFGKQEGDMHLSFWTGRPDPSLTYELLFAEGSFFNAGREATPGMAAALTEAQSGATLEARKAAFVKVQRIAVENALSCPIMFDVQMVVHSKRLNGFRPNLIGKPKFEGVTLT